METVGRGQILDIILKVEPMRFLDGLDLGHKVKESGMTRHWNLQFYHQRQPIPQFSVGRIKDRSGKKTCPWLIMASRAVKYKRQESLYPFWPAVSPQRMHWRHLFSVL